ncbi:hypothetical protein [Streptomyces sp. NPDC002520]
MTVTTAGATRIEDAALARAARPGGAAAPGCCPNAAARACARWR